MVGLQNNFYQTCGLAIVLVLCYLPSSIDAGNFTVTHEAWVEFEVRGMDGPGEDFRGKVHFALFGETCPMTVLNFVSLVNGYKLRGSKLHYKNSYVHRIVKDFVVQMGDIVRGDGAGSVSIYGNRFNDENFILSHRSAGWVAMANHGPDTNGSQFFILLTKARWMDGKHVVFARVTKGMDVLNTLGEVETHSNAVPKKSIKIVDCEAKQLEKTYDLKEVQLPE
jgi:peptidyl-prolyl cis-trans isomerase B (cyclophilin B)